MKQPWIFSARFDGLFILAPAIFITCIVLAFGSSLETLQKIPAWLWLILIVGIDVSHVYSTLFRTYLDRTELKKRQMLYILTPLIAWIAGSLIYSISDLLFWRVLAYLAVFHFVRQQYGFMMIYARQERQFPASHKWIDKIAIYAATLYPLIYWHCHTREFEWFVKNDFLSFNIPYMSQISGILYLLILTAYIGKEAYNSFKTSSFNIPKNLLLFGTGFAWFIGIIAFNNDLAFTATNVIAHGIPYLALIWAYEHNKNLIDDPKRSLYVWPFIRNFFQWKAVPLYIGCLSLLAFLEETVWDGLIWREHGSVFGLSQIMPAIQNPSTLIWLVPLLALPQTTHYILDAFIWRLNSEGTNWKQVLFYQTTSKT